MKTFLEYIGGKAFALESKLKDEYVFNHFFYPLKIDTKIKYADVLKQIKRLLKLYRDTAGTGLQDETEALYYLIRNQFFNQDDWIGQCDSSVYHFYQSTKKAGEQILSIKQLEKLRQNQLIEIVLRNLLIIGTNAASQRERTEFSTVDVDVNSIGFLCSSQMEYLFRDHFYSFDAKLFSDLIAFVHKRGGLPTTYTIWCEDPNDNRSIFSKLVFGQNEIPTDSEITRRDCIQAMLFYAVLLTALVTKLEATIYDKIYGYTKQRSR